MTRHVDYWRSATAATLVAACSITPLARTDDGLLDVVILGATDRRTLVSELLPRVYRGSHLRHQAVHFARGTAITVEASPALPLELDGEIVGTTPARFSLLPAYLDLLVPGEDTR